MARFIYVFVRWDIKTLISEACKLEYMFLEGLSVRKAGESVANLCAASEATVKWVTSALLTKERQKER